MIRKIIRIDESKCTGCGLCANACHEGAIDIVNGKAKLVRENYCDGLGDCLPACPADAISFEEREAPAYDEKAVYGDSRLSHWPVQIKLLPIYDPCFSRDLLISADCAAYAYGNFHKDFIKNRTVLIGCPKLDAVDYSEKLAEIFKSNDVRSITVVRMEVPCCGGLERAVFNAIIKSGKKLSVNIVTISSEGEIL